MWEWSGLEVAALAVYLILFFSAYVSQCLTIRRNRSSTNVNFTSFIRLCAGQFFWTVYSFSIGKIGFFIGSALTFCSLIVLAALIIAYRPRSPGDHGDRFKPAQSRVPARRG